MPTADQKKNPVTITMDANKNVTALFEVSCFSLTTKSSPASSGVGFGLTRAQLPRRTRRSTPTGRTCSLTANPASGYKFSSWSG